MQYQFNPLAVPFFLAAIISLFLSVYAVRARPTPQTRSFGFLMGVGFMWTGAYAMFTLSNNVEAASFWWKAMFTGSAYTPIALWLFTLRQTRQRRWLSFWVIAFYFTLATAIMLLAVTNDMHHQMFTGQMVNGIYQIFPGPLYGFYLATTYVFTIGSVVLLVQAYRRSTGVFRTQAAMMIFGVMIPVCFSVLTDVIGWELIPNFDESIFSLVITGIIFAVAIFRYQSLEVLPVAHQLVIENMDDGVIVLDTQDRVLFSNPAARRIIGVDGKQDAGEMVPHLLQRWSAQAALNWAKRDPEFEVKTTANGQDFYYLLRTSKILNENVQTVARLIVIQDMSDRKQLERRLELMATTDSLTESFNRRYFMDLAEKELMQAYRYRHDLTVVMLDIDHFKQVNDSFGHLAGDMVLRGLAQICHDQIRGNDLFGRYGGEEFVLLLPETDPEQGFRVAERLRERIEETPLLSENSGKKLTVSIGLAGIVAGENITLETLLDRADRAMYLSKQNGRNRVTMWGKLPIPEIDQ